MGGGGRVLTALERNAQYLDCYVNFIKTFKHIDLEKGEIEINFPKKYDNSYVKSDSQYISRKVIPISLVQNNEKILAKLEQMLFETDDIDEILSFYFENNRKRFRALHSEFLYNDENNPSFLGKKFWKDFERKISKNPRYSYRYAFLTNKRFELGEPAIAKCAVISLDYAKNIIGGRFELGESSIATDNKLLFEYSDIIGPLPKHLYNRMISNCIAPQEM